MDPDLGKKVRVRIESTSQFGPWNPTYKYGYYAGEGDSGTCVEFEDGNQDWFDYKQIEFIND